MAFPARTAPASPVDRSSASPASPSLRREHLESLLRARKLDRTLTTTLPGVGDHDGAAFGMAALDAALGGGLPRGQISELTGPPSSGRTSLAWTWLGAATARGETAAVIDTFDRFDPFTASQCGIALPRLLWVRGQAITRTSGALDPAWLPGARAVEGPGTLLERTIDRALKAVNLVLQSGVCTAVLLDMADVPLAGIRRVPATTWLRLQRIVEGTGTACLLMGPVPLARSAGGVSLAIGASPDAAAAGPGRGVARGAARWDGTHDRSRRLSGLSLTVRLSSPRWTKADTIGLSTVTRGDRWAVE